MKNQIKNGLERVRRVVVNAEQFVQAVALVTIAGFSYWSLERVDLQGPMYWIVYGSLVVIALRGAYEIFNFLDNKHES